MNGIWLDNDGGNLTPSGLRALFSDLWFATFGTHSNGGRYRVFIPTKTPMTVEADGLIKKMIINVIREAGYKDNGEKLHGFDLGKLVASSLFFMPCRAPGDTSAYFIEYPGTELDPVAWLENTAATSCYDPAAIAPTVAELTHQGSSDRADVTGKIERAKDEYLSVPAGQGKRNDAFFRLGLQLRKAGCPATEIRQHLSEVAFDNDRRSQIASVVTSLTRSL